MTAPDLPDADLDRQREALRAIVYDLVRHEPHVPLWMKVDAVIEACLLAAQDAAAVERAARALVAADGMHWDDLPPVLHERYRRAARAALAAAWGTS